MKKAILVLLPLLLLVGCSNTPQTKFYRVGQVLEDELFGYTYYVQNPTKESIDDFSQAMVNVHGTEASISIYYYDDVDTASKYEDEYGSFAPQKEPNKHLVAKFFYDDTDLETQMKFYQEIPE